MQIQQAIGQVIEGTSLSRQDMQAVMQPVSYTHLTLPTTPYV